MGFSVYGVTYRSVMLNISKLSFPYFILKSDVSCNLNCRSEEHVTFSVFCFEVLHILKAVLDCSSNEDKSSNGSKNESTDFDESPVSDHSDLIDFVSC